MTRVLITGASAGLGAEYARQLAARGDDLVLVARDGGRLEALAGDLHGVEVEVLPADLLDPEQIARVEERLRDPEKPVDMLINNAGYGMGLAFERNDVEDEVKHLRLHNEVPLRLSHAALPGMLARGHGRIVNIASVAAFTPRSTYGACKRWLVDISRWMSGEYGTRGVTATAVCPGYTHTEFHARLGLPPGQEGIPGWMWLDAPDVIAESLRDIDRGKALSVPSRRYKAIVALLKVVPAGVAARASARGR
ncbi:SDR family NAD(P)-dependent oxidoreductase [Pseudactinotalea sp.]|uniref:SDR family NAD(P)-dependent oxidoreductase n=1 Tax=Pseudactinotalea sp. TaxID=1926260 RepID=UPI003B3ABB39